MTATNLPRSVIWFSGVRAGPAVRALFVLMELSENPKETGKDHALPARVFPCPLTIPHPHEYLAPPQLALCSQAPPGDKQVRSKPKWRDFGVERPTRELKCKCRRRPRPPGRVAALDHDTSYPEMHTLPCFAFCKSITSPPSHEKSCITSETKDRVDPCCPRRILTTLLNVRTQSHGSCSVARFLTDT